MPNTLVALIPSAAADLPLTFDDAVESILADIPPICVGLMAFGIFTFFLVMKRVNLAAVYLYSSCLFAFGAAILDLTQVLARGRSRSIGLNVVTGLIMAREIGISVSMGFIYLFMWVYVAQCPRGETQPADTPTESTLLHSASWRRWGVFGIVLKWTLLTMVFAIPILQIVWRVLDTEQRYGPIYVAEATIEIVASALFLLKLLLNVLLTPLSPWWRPLSWYLGPIVALGIGITLGLANLMTFAFSDTTTGRFLFAIELYMLLLFILIATFYNAPTTSSSAAMRGRVRDSDLFSMQPRFTIVDGPPPPAVTTTSPVRPPRNSAISRLSWWLNSRNFSRLADDTEKQVQALQKPSPSFAKNSDISDTTSRSSSSFTRRSSEQEKDKANLSLPANEGRNESKSAPRPIVDVAFPSYYGLERSPRGSYLKNGTDSSINGVESNVQQTKQPSSMTSLDELLRQQTELDKSIATLRLFSPENEMAVRRPGSPPSPPNAISTDSSVDITNNPSTNPGRESGRSEFSLSVFPEPPNKESTESLASLRNEDSGRSSPSTIRPANVDKGKQPERYLNTSPTPPQNASLSNTATASQATARELPALRPLLLGTGQLPPNNGSSTMVPIGWRSLPRIPQKPKFAISGPVPQQPLDGQGDQAPGAFERPRPPPVVIPESSGFAY